MFELGLLHALLFLTFLLLSDSNPSSSSGRRLKTWALDLDSGATFLDGHPTETFLGTLLELRIAQIVLNIEVQD